MKRRLLNLTKQKQPNLYALIGSFVITAGWNWYHLAKRPQWRFALISLVMWAGVFVAYQAGKWVYTYLVARFNRHPFWQQEFKRFLDKIFLVSSLFFLVFFSRYEWLSLLYFLAVLGLLYHRLQTYLSAHPDSSGWKAVNRSMFLILVFLFLVLSVFQYSAYHYYILDSNIRFYNIVLFRSWAMTMFWACGFALASLLYWKLKGISRYIFLSVWSLLFLLVIAVWVVNIGVLYFSGLYFSPVALQHAEGGGGVVRNTVSYMLIGGGIGVVMLFGLLLKKVSQAHVQSWKKHWVFYNSALVAVAVFSIVGVSSFKNTPEFVMARSFYNYFKGVTQMVELKPYMLSKLERFGLKYNPDQFYLAHKDTVFSQPKRLLPDKFKTTKPNVIIIFWEGLSARLTSVYNNNIQGLTPYLEAFAADKNTTVFRNVYNGSTPTITGLISELCSFLPPTGHEEIERYKKIQRHHLLCLPQVLRQQAGYNYANYVTAVKKNFAHKDSIIASMGVDTIYGTDELADIVKAKPLSWGYSDHQMFPAFLTISEREAKEPFLSMISTVDSHPPFTISKDRTLYGDGKRELLNSFHSTDDAFGKFWNAFKQSRYYDNTIVVVIGDHSVFPGALTKDLFPNSQEAKKMIYYDELGFLMYVPDSILPDEVSLYASGIDLTPTLLHMLNINVPNSFEGHSIFDDREHYPNLLGMHEFGLYSNQVNQQGKRTIDYNIPSEISCAEKDYNPVTSSPLTLCEFKDYYYWKKQLFEEGRFWKR